MAAADITLREDSVQGALHLGCDTRGDLVSSLRISIAQSEVVTVASVFEDMTVLARYYDDQNVITAVRYGRINGTERGFGSREDKFRDGGKSAQPFHNLRLGHPKEPPGPDGKLRLCRTCTGDNHYAYSYL